MPPALFPLVYFSDRVLHIFLGLDLDLDPPISISGVAGITDVNYHVWPNITTISGIRKLRKIEPLAHAPENWS
jgi:hypothetical protein